MNRLLFYNEMMEEVFKEILELECFKNSQLPGIEIADDQSHWQNLPNQNIRDMTKTLRFLYEVFWANHNLKIRLNHQHEIIFCQSEFFNVAYSETMDLHWQTLRPIEARINQLNYIHPAFTNDLDYSISNKSFQMNDETMKCCYLKERLFYRHHSIVRWTPIDLYCWKYSLERLIPESITGKNFIQFLFYSLSFYNKNFKTLRSSSALDTMIDIREDRRFVLKICIDSQTFFLNLTEKQIEKRFDN